jgi:hypothetical protein
LSQQISNLKFRSAVHRAFPDKSSARAARFADVGQRTMQKWLAGESDVPAAIATLVEVQGNIADQTDVRRHLEESCQEFLDADGHPEALGSILSAVYQKIMGKPIE